MNIKYFWYRVKFRLFPSLLKNEEFVYILKTQGISVGKGTIFYNPQSMQIDRSRPYLLSIGDYCKITSGVSILTHDYSRSVLRRRYGDIIGEGRFTSIGNNVFIGLNSIILMGTKLGHNVIVGAGSVVSGVFPDDVVIGGNPAKIICSLDEFYKKRKRRMLDDAKEIVCRFVEKNNRLPSINECEPFWWLFLERDRNILEKSGVKINLGGDSKEEILEAFLQSKPVFDSFESFLHMCIRDDNEHSYSKD